MIIYSRAPRKNRLRLYRSFGRPIPRARRRVAATLFLGGFYLVSIVVTAMIAQWMYRYGMRGPHELAVEIKQSLLKLAHLPDYLSAIGHELPDIYLDIKFKDIQKLEELRQKSLEHGTILKNEDNDLVPIQIRADGSAVRARARFKGNALDNISGTKRALRIKVSGEEPILGMVEFSLRIPETFNEAAYPFHLFAMKREDIPVPRLRFVKVFVNGESKGVFGMEEEMSPELIEFNARREGVILAYNEDALWETWDDAVARHSSPFNNWQSAEIQIFNEKKVRKLASLGEQADVAISLLADFRNGKLPPSAVFDVPILARFLALNSLLGGGHSSIWRNARFLYNPVSFRLEPICRDGSEVNGTQTIDYLMAEEGSMYMSGLNHPTQTPTVAMNPSLGTIHRAWFSEPEIFEQYIRELERVSSDIYIENLLKEAQPLFQESLNALRREKAGMELDSSFIRANQQTIRKALNPPRCIQARIQPSGAGVAVSVANVLTLPVRMTGFRVNGIPREPMSPGSLYLEGKAPADPLLFRTYFLESPPAQTNQVPPTVEILHEIPGTDRLRTHVAQWFQAEFDPKRMVNSPADALGALPRRGGKSRDPRLIDPILSAHPFLTRPGPEAQIGVRSGQWNVEGDLIIPHGYSLAIGPDTALSFQSNAFFRVHGPIHLRGTSEQPVVLSPQNDTWQGLVVMEAGGPSICEHVIFARTDAPRVRGSGFTGGVTFYKSDATFQQCLFRDSKGEDALNPIHSRIKLIGVAFTNTVSDALDADFCEEIDIVRSSFLAIGDDAIDVSSSKLTMDGATIDRVGDKGISVGEGSTAQIRNASIQHCKTGIASKDGSSTTVDHVRILDSQVGSAVYVHKQHFGPGKLEANGVVFDRCGLNLQIERKSLLYLDGRLQPANAEKVWEDFQAVGKKTKL